MKTLDAKTSFSFLSKFRAELMGFSALLIVFFHFHVWQLVPEYTKYILRFTFGGVDMFLFLSGVGLCYSMKKDPCIKSFYRKRFTRIYPSFWIVTTISMFFSKKTILSVTLAYTGITYWLTPFFNVTEGFWYIGLIIILYVLFPFIYKFMTYNSVKVCIIMLSIVFVLPYGVHFLWGNYYDYGLARMTPFLIGSFLYIKRDTFPNLGKLLIFSSIFLFFVLNLYSLLSGGANTHKTLIQLSLLGLIAPGFCLLFSLLFSLCNRYILICLNRIGKISLELYMVHLVMFHWFKTPLILFVISLIVSYFIYCISLFIKKILG